MPAAPKPFRSLLYIPGSKERALEKATGLAADGIIFDLEDAVAPDEKANARNLVAASLERLDYGARGLMVRINGFDTQWAMDDLEVISATGPEAILLPKVNSAADVERLASFLDQHPKCADTAIWAMMETPLSILNAAGIAAAPRMAGMVMGTNDLANDLMADLSVERPALLTSLSIGLLAARAYGLYCIDGVYNKFRDTEGLRAQCEQGRDFGMDGKSLIHPAQIDIANEVFAPSPEALDLATRQIQAFEEAEAQGLGIAVLDGRIVENLHVASARKLLEKQVLIEKFSQAAR